jgi:hypothetical protein
MKFEKASVVCAVFEMPCSSLKVSWRFGGTYHVRLQALRVSQAGKHHEAGCASWQFDAGFLLDLVFDPKNRGDIPQKPRLRTTRHWISEDTYLQRPFLYSRLASVCACTETCSRRKCLLEPLFALYIYISCHFDCLPSAILLTWTVSLILQFPAASPLLCLSHSSHIRVFLFLSNSVAPGKSLEVLISGKSVQPFSLAQQV